VVSCAQVYVNWKKIETHFLEGLYISNDQTSKVVGTNFENFEASLEWNWTSLLWTFYVVFGRFSLGWERIKFDYQKVVIQYFLLPPTGRKYM